MAVRQRKSSSPRKSTKKRTSIAPRPASTAKRVAKSMAKPARRVARTSSPIPDRDLRTPAQTSSHGSFDRRSEKDPDKIPAGEKILNEQFAEVDEYTNKTGDPRIGTRGRR